MFIYLNKIFLYFIVSFLRGLPSLYWNSWTYLHGEWFSRDQNQMMPDLLRDSLELAGYRFCHILLVRMSQKPRPGSRGEVASTLDWSSTHTGMGELLDAIVAGDPPHQMWLGPPLLGKARHFFLLKPVFKTLIQHFMLGLDRQDSEKGGIARESRT